MAPAPCPFLPAPVRRLSWRDLAAYREDRGPELYRLCLEYGQQLWLEDLPARALLAVDRALYCEVDADEPILTTHPLPYRVIGWMVSQPSRGFTGNARVHYQHLADRVRGAQAERKKWRAWAAWAVVRQVRPDLTGDARHSVVEPTHELISDGLRRHGVRGETDVWLKALAN